MRSGVYVLVNTTVMLVFRGCQLDYPPETLIIRCKEELRVILT